ncbi:Gluconate 5-dehydrogenase [Gammaproteobacteria bacterium]
MNPPFAETSDLNIPGFDLTGQIAVVTGGAGWLGRAMTLALAAAGAVVVVASRDLRRCQTWSEELQHRGYRALALAVDIGRRESVQALAQAVKAAVGPATILVNNAAGGRGATLDAMTAETWHSVMDSNVTGYFWCCQAFGAEMLARRQGVVVNVASILGLRGYAPSLIQSAETPPPLSYSTAKGAIISLTRALAAEWGSAGIRVNALTPGAFPPPGRHAEGAYLQALRSRIPLGRLGDASEIAGPLLFLCSPASGYMTGHNLVVDGGWSAS